MASSDTPGRWTDYVLRFPLAGKLAGANALVVIVVLATAMGLHGSGPEDREMLVVLALALAASFVVNLALVTIALRPLRVLESTAARVRQGDLEARVMPSALADRDMRRVGDALNLLLDELVEDRARIRRLAAEVIRAGDAERARLARELHDSTAQTLSAVVMQLAAAARDSREKDLGGRLEAIRAAALDALEEVRLLSLAVHPRVLDDLGLPAALSHLAREAGNNSDVQIDVNGPHEARNLPADRASVLYRVAQEAVANALRHGAPTAIGVRLHLSVDSATLEVNDDGTGFDPLVAARVGQGLGIFSMRERVALVGGTFELVSRPGSGTTVRASVPIALTATTPGPAE